MDNNIDMAHPVKLHFDAFGQSHHELVILLPGLGAHAISWTEPFCQLIANAGYYVVRIDNRDVGLPTHLKHVPSFDLMTEITKLQQGKKSLIPYSLFDMAADVIALLDQLCIRQAHIIGRSMGGMIAQLIAATAPERTLSLTAIMSSTGNSALPQAKADVMAMLFKPKPNPVTAKESYIEEQLKFYRRIASTVAPFNEREHRDYIERTLLRNFNAEGTKRQIAALAITGDIRESIKTITAKTLVIHGDADPLIPMPCGQDIAHNIAQAQFMPIQGMGHELPAYLHTTIASAIIKHIGI